MKTILISGKSGSGKDTLANFLKTEYQNTGKKVIIIHFADMVKEFAKLYYNWNEEKDVAGRHLLQYVGTTVVRKAFPNYWAELVAKFLAAENLTGSFDIALIPDLRFLNEYKIVKKYNKDCYTIRINKIDEDGEYILSPILTDLQNNHPSECELDDFSFDIMVNNNGTLDDLKNAAHEIIEEYLK